MTSFFFTIYSQTHRDYAYFDKSLAERTQF